MKLNAKQIKRFLTQTGLFSDDDLKPLIRQIKITQPLTNTTLISFKLKDILMGLLFDSEAESDDEVLEQAKTLGTQTQILRPKGSSDSHFMLDSKVVYLVTTQTTKVRLDQKLTELYPQHSRSQLTKLIKQGVVKVDGQVIKKPNFTLSNELVTADFPQKESIDLPILFEDKEMIAIDKPVGVLSHSLNKFDNEWTVDDSVHLKSSIPGGNRAVAHRLDRDTSGVIIGAKAPESLLRLQNLFRQRQVEKTYFAIVGKKPSHDHAVINLPIARSMKQPSKQVVSSNGREATTEFEVVGKNKIGYVIKVTPKTGRTHQIRVHLAHIGCPIIGDRLYGGKKYERLLLHAAEISMQDVNSKNVTIKSPLPAEFLYEPRL